MSLIHLFKHAFAEANFHGAFIRNLVVREKEMEMEEESKSELFAPMLEGLVKDIGAPLMTEIFIVVLFLTFASACWNKFKGKQRSFTQYAPTLLTSLGILGTFFGIVAGLLGFDTDHIDESIGSLLEGMKTAFMTSLVGIALSILYKGLASLGILSPKDDNLIGEDQVGVDDLYQVMKQQVSGIESLQQAIGGDGDSSLTSQLKMFRGDVNDNHKFVLQSDSKRHEELASAISLQINSFKSFEEKLWVKLQDFADMLSKSATETVIEALKQVITDFNTNLTEQFGENFKQLNKACKELVTWQDQYKVQLGDMTIKYGLGVESIGLVSNAVGDITKHTAAIPVHMEQLKEITEINQHQIKELERHLEAFKDIRDKAVDAVPEIRSQIDDTLEGVKAAADELAKGIKESSDTMGNAMVQGAQDTLEGVKAAADELAKGIKESSDTMGSAIVQGAQDTLQGVKVATDELAKGIKESSDTMGNAIVKGAQEFVDNSGKVNGALQASSDVMLENSEKSRVLYANLAEEMNANARSLSSHMQEEAIKITEEYSIAGKQLLEELNASKTSFHSGLETMREQLNVTLESMVTRQTEEANKIFNGLSSQIENSLASTGDAVDKKVQMIDKALVHEIENVMNEMGGALASISKQFTKDYTQLVNAMQIIVKKGND